MRISDWSSDVCSSDLGQRKPARNPTPDHLPPIQTVTARSAMPATSGAAVRATRPAGPSSATAHRAGQAPPAQAADAPRPPVPALQQRSDEHTSELQSLMRTSYAVFCLKKKNKKQH